MKRLLYLVVALCLLGCTKKELLTYTDGDGLFFDTREMFLDTVNVSWGLKNNEIKTQKVKLNVKLIGHVADYDRTFYVKVKDDPSDLYQAKIGVDYQQFPLEYVLPKGKASTMIEIDVLRNPILHEENRWLTVQLVETDEFKFLYSRKLEDSLGNRRLLDVQRVIKMNENFPKPRWWLVFGDRVFGKWSLKKQILICELMGIDREKWVGDVVSDPTFSEGYLRFCGVKVHRWLEEQKKNGETYYEADDITPMQMGPDSKR
ncbi:DUF4843 domain-containing protein [Sphingobacterium faecale]|uniref:DUF4843 domain-containing protein n=1 Tax=Sphingobacterium faecale TaxID=2803775 RepID=A0ABS1R929_9SPHI|nr:DUF4843 domain-containing protein [Sphingobacterium faecale]MBL1411215.1 DUF4843 domain-containing protein [Sphingobacterium faecale]